MLWNANGLHKYKKQQEVVLHTYLAQTPEIGLGRILSCGARKQEQT